MSLGESFDGYALENLVIRTTTNTESLFKMVNAHRVDYGIFYLHSGLRELKRLRLDDNIRPIFPEISKEPIHVAFSRKSKCGAAIAQLAEELTKMKQDGVTTIPEALRLAPGVIVYEQTNGQYAVYIRGFQNTPNNTNLASLENRHTLVMIDNRPVYNHFNGGISWENFGISVDDIDRIELVRGASSALYGPNAVTGVIHIVTKRANKSFYSYAGLTVGGHDTRIARATTQGNFQDHAIRFSAFDESRDRFQDSYYDTVADRYVMVEEAGEPGISITPEFYPKPERAKETKGFNLSIQNDPNEILNYDLMIFEEEASVQKVRIGATTIFDHNESLTRSANLKLNYEDLTLRLSHDNGEHELIGLPQFDYDQSITQANIDYQFRLPKWIIQPGISYEDAEYEGDYIGGERHIYTSSYSLRTEFSPTLKNNFIAAIRHDDYNVADKNYLSYQLIATHKYDSDTHFRVGLSTANQSAFMIDSYVDLSFGSAVIPNLRSEFKGDRGGSLSTIRTLEAGVRHQYNFNSWLDIEIFSSQLKNTSDYVIQETRFEDGMLIRAVLLEELPTKANQLGLTVDWHYEEVDWDLNLFATYQDTDLDDQFATLNVNTEYYDTHNDGTPSWFGGLVTNWQPDERWNLNVHCYYTSKSTTKLNTSEGSTYKIPSQTNLNVTATRTYNRWVTGFVSFRNLFSRGEPQYFVTDEIKPSVLFGFEIGFDH